MTDSFLLLETGDFLLLESGDKLILEEGVEGRRNFNQDAGVPRQVWRAIQRQKAQFSQFEFTVLAEPMLHTPFPANLRITATLHTLFKRILKIHPLVTIISKILEASAKPYLTVPSGIVPPNIITKFKSPSMRFASKCTTRFRQAVRIRPDHDRQIIREALKALELDSIQTFEFSEPADMWADAVTNTPPIGEPTEQERELTFNQPSSFVGTVVYSPDTQTMEIDLNGKTFGFCNVPQSVFAAFESASSKGAYFTRFIKGQFNC